MIEGGAKPCRDRVALLATGWESRGRVIGACRLLVGCRVARVALERKPLKLADGRSLVTTVALQRGMAADQRKPVLVIPDGLNRHLPALHVVATFAVCTHLPVMDVGVTIPAPGAGIGKNRFRVTLRARQVFVHTQQREAGFTVIKFRNSAYRFPSENGVAILARAVQVGVRTARIATVPRACAYANTAVAPINIPTRAQTPDTLRAHQLRHRTPQPCQPVGCTHLSKRWQLAPLEIVVE